MATSKKTTAKKSTTIKPIAKKAMSATKATFKAAAKKTSAVKTTAGFTKNDNGLYVPAMYSKPVPAGKLQEGFKKAKQEITKMIGEIADIMTDKYKISEITLSASFSADGKFLGFGVGGATTITLKISPE